MSQFLSGPYCSLRLMDLGARVIKIERPDGGDLSRRLYLSDTEIGGDSTIFHAINRAKESFAVDLKDADDLAGAARPARQGRRDDPEFPAGRHRAAGARLRAVQAINPRLVYASISGYGEEGPWVKRPGPGSAGAVALRRDVAERRRGSGSGAVRSGGRRHAGGRGLRAGHSCRAGAARHHRQGRACRDQPARSAGRLPVRGADDASQRRPAAAAPLIVPQRACLSLGALRRLSGQRTAIWPSP